MLHDLVVAARTLIKRPAYSASVVLTLGIGIAATTVVFSLLDAVVLRPLPFGSPDRLVSLTGVAGPRRDPRGGSFPEIADWRALNRTLTDVSIYDEISLNLQIGSEAMRVDAEMVSASYFPILGARANLGRTFLPEEDAVVDRNPVAVISDALWKRKFGATRDVLQQTVQLNDRTFAIVGVMPPDFAGLSFDTDVWIPSMMVSTTSSTGVVTNRGTRWLGAVGRMNDSVTLDAVREDLDRVASLLEAQHPETNRQRGVQVDELQDSLAGDTGPLVVAIFTMVMMFLAVACANIASLQLVRAAGRRRELAVRFALGARRWHVVRQLTIESIVLAVVAAAVGWALAAWALGGLLSIAPEGSLPRHAQPALDVRTAVFAVTIAFLAGAAAAILPALAVTRRDLVGTMKEGARSAGPGLGSLRRPSTQQFLVVVEVAVAMVLLVIAGVTLQGLDRQLRVPLGFDPAGVTVAQISLPAARYSPQARTAFVERVLENLRAIPQVAIAAAGTSLPFTGNSSASIMLPDVAEGPEGALRYYRNFVSPDFFSTLGLPLKSGRGLTSHDRADTPLVAIINESGARRIWGQRDAVGRRVKLGAGPDAPSVEIVGVAADARFRDLTSDVSRPNAEPNLYFPFSQRTDRDIAIAVRTADGSTVPFGALQQAVAAVDPGVPAYAVQLLSNAVRQQTSTARLGSMLTSIFSTGSLLLAAVGLYGLVAYVVSLSRREIAIRLALGAASRRVAALIIGNGLVLVTLGVLAGGAGAMLAARYLQTQLFAVDHVDLMTMAGSAILLFVVACAACIIPTRRAIGVDPQIALRLE